MRNHKNRFVMVYLPGGPRFMGTLDSDDIARWELSSASVVELVHPKLYMEAPVMHPGVQVNTQVQIVIQPVHNSPTDQEELLVSPMAIEVIGSLTQDENGWVCSKANNVWMPYEETIKRWMAAKSGIVAPTAIDISKIRKLCVPK